MILLMCLFQLPHLTELLEEYSLLFLVDDMLQSKFGKKFEYVQILHDHARHLRKEFVTLAVAFSHAQSC